MKRIIIALAAFGLFRPDVAQGQSGPVRFDAGVQIASPRSSQFDAVDVGLGGRLAWHPVGLVGVEAEINVYPGDFPEPHPFSRGRVEGLFGATVGPRIGGVRPFVRARPGFVRFHEAPAPFPCILIYPPPLACVLASGRTPLALDIGGGVEITLGARTFVRVDAGDRLLRYPGPAFGNDRTRHEHAFVSHEFRFAAGAGVRF